MNRCTYYDKKQKHYIRLSSRLAADNKLGMLEDLEDELGCPLEVVAQALKNGVYYEDVANCMKYMVADLQFNLEGDFVLYFDEEECLLVRNYKKTWWLKVDKSE